MRAMWLMLSACMVLCGCASTSKPVVDDTRHTLVFDSIRNRMIPIVVYFNSFPEKCSEKHLCPVVFINPDEGVQNQQYSFLAKKLQNMNFLVVAVKNTLPTDPPLPTDGADALQARKDVWQRDAENIRYLRTVLQGQYRMFDWDHLVMIGHGDGADAALWFAHQSPGMVRAVVALDNLRVPLPKKSAPKVLALRAADSRPPAGLLPDASDQARYGQQVVTIADSRRLDMQDDGPDAVKAEITTQILQFFQTSVGIMAP